MKTRLLITLMLLVAIVTGVNAANFVAQIYCEGWATDDASGNKVFDFDASGTLTYTAPGASYVFVRNDETGVQYCTDGWTDFANPVTLVNQNSLSNPGNFEKFYVPSGEHTLYLIDNGDDTFTIAYDKDIRTKNIYVYPKGWDITGNKIAIYSWNPEMFDDMQADATYPQCFKIRAVDGLSACMFVLLPESASNSFDNKLAQTSDVGLELEGATGDILVVINDEKDWLNRNKTEVTTIDHLSDYITPSLSKDEEDNYLIASAADWKAFAELVKTEPTANARMTEDIDLGDDQTMIGNNNNYPFSGIFDGQGHTLTVAYNNNNSESYVAPFSYINGATIRNIHFAGTIQTACQNAGIISKYGGSGNVVEKVWNSLDITTNWTANSRNWECSSGFIGSTLSGSGGSLTMRDCLFTGSLTALSGNRNGCFIGYVDSGCSAIVTNCLSLGSFTFNNDGYKSIGKDGMNTSYCYVRQFPADIPTEMQITDVELADGTIAYKLQNNRADLVWGQRIGIDAEPVLTSDESYRVYKSKNGGYTNNPEDAYEGLKQDGEGNYLLASAADWKAFAELVKTEPTANAKMTADIDLGDDQTMAGTEEHPYQGTFDGQGHTLNVNYDVNITRAAPFRFITNATIRNLHVTGSLTTTAQTGGGIVSWTEGTCLIEKCYSSVVITANKVSATADTYGGIIGCNYKGNLTLQDCIFDGSITTTEKDGCGGLVGFTEVGGTATATNCLLTATFDLNNNNTNVTLLRHAGYGTVENISNCYYLNGLYVKQGTQVTDEQLANGTIATALQADRDETVWVQDEKTGRPIQSIFYRYGLSKDEEGYYLLASAADWKAFAELVKTTPTANAKMTADIDLGDDQTMVGSIEYPYHGNFDGLGHTLTVNLDSYYTFDKGSVAPFSCVKDATIKNLHVAGSLKQQYCAAGGVAGNIQGNLTVSQCWVSAYIYVQGYGNYQGTIGGIASYCDDPNVRNCEIVIEDCIFSGEFGTGIHSGSIMSHVNGEYGNHAILRNCLNIGTFPSASGNSGTFIRPIQGNSFAIDNCYYRNSFGYIQGSQATDSQLSDGTIATTLQAGRTDPVWVQDPDRNCPMLLVFSTSDPDGIKSPFDSPDGDGKAAWYDLSGRRVLKPSRGLYIVNGKKVLVQ